MFFVLISSLIRPMDISTPCLSACHSLLCRNDKESACSKICTYQKRWVYGHMSSSIFQGVQLAEGFEPTVPERILTPGTERIPTPGTERIPPPGIRRIRTRGTRKRSQRNWLSALAICLHYYIKDLHFDYSLIV